MNNRAILKKIRRTLHSEIWGDRVNIVVRTTQDFGDNYATYWEKQSYKWKENGYIFYGYKTKPHHAKLLLKEIQKKFSEKYKILAIKTH